MVRLSRLLRSVTTARLRRQGPKSKRAATLLIWSVFREVNLELLAPSLRAASLPHALRCQELSAYDSDQIAPNGLQEG